MRGKPAERSPAVVLATRPLGEADLLVVLLTPGMGKVRAAARHARKSKRRFAGGLSGGAMGEATLALRPGGLSRLDSFTPTRDHGALGRDLTRFAYVAYLCELTDVLLHEPEPDPSLFAVLTQALARTIDSAPRASTLRHYELHLLLSLGLLPALDACAVCGEPLAKGPTVPFDELRGGSLCLAHGRTATRRPTPVLHAAHTLLVATSETQIDTALEAVEATPSTTRRALRDLTTAWLRPYIRHPLRSREFFTKLGPQAGPSKDS